MTYPNKKGTMFMLSVWEAEHQAVRKLCDGIETVIGNDPDGPLFGTVWGLFDAYTKTLERLLGADDWLDWYAHENNMGHSAGQAGYDGRTKPIKSLEDLHGLIVECRKK